MIAPMRILAIGATGFIGPYVVRTLDRLGHSVAVLHRGRTHAALPAATLPIRGDHDSLHDATAEIRRFGPDVVLDLILYTEKQARALVGALRGVAGRLVVASSADVYRNYDGFRGKSIAPADPTPLTEDAPLRETRYPYRGSGSTFDCAEDYDKILVEDVVRDQPDLPVTVLRLPAVYGPGDKAHRFRPWIRRIDDGRPAILMSDRQAGWRWTRGYVENVAEAIVLAVTQIRAAGRTYNAGESSTPTEREWVERIGAAAGWRGRVVSVPESRLPTHLRQPYDWRYDLHTSTDRIRAELGYAERVPRHEALARTLAWERSASGEPDRPDYSAEDAVLEQGG